VDGTDKAVVSPVSLVVTAFAAVGDVRCTLTPQLHLNAGDSRLLLIDLGAGRGRLGGSALAQVLGATGSTPPDLDHPELLAGLFRFVRQAAGRGWLLAYHDRSDGGLWATLCEMAFAGHCGLDIDLDHAGGYAARALFNEEVGAVVQVRAADLARVQDLAGECGIRDLLVDVGAPRAGGDITVRHGGRVLIDAPRVELHRLWSATSHAIARRRDDPECADAEYDVLLDADDPGLTVHLPFAVRSTRPTGANAVTTSDTGDTTALSVPSASRQVVFMDSESLPTGMAMRSAGHSSMPTARTAAYSAASSPGSPAAAIQLADSLMAGRSATSAAAMLVIASATARRAAAAASSRATGGRSPIAIASPL
jgi:hypothetical protein